MSDTEKPQHTKKVIQIGIAALAIVMSVAAVWLWPLKEEPLKIGAILSLSTAGRPSEIGSEVRDGILLAVEAINVWGGLNGRKLEVIVEDSESNPEKACSIFHRIERSEQPLAYISTLSSVSVALAPAAEAHNVVLMALVATAPELTTSRDWTFRYWPTAQNETLSTIELARKLGVNTIGVLYLDDEYGRNAFAIAKAQWEKSSGEIRGEAFQIQESIYRPHIANLFDMEGIFIIGYPSHMLMILKQLQEHEFQGIVLSNNSAALPSSRSMPQTEGVYTMAPIVYKPNFLFARELKEQFETHYKTPFNHLAANGYDVVKMLASVLEGKDVSREHLRDLLDAGFIYPGVFGDIHVKPGSHDITFPHYPSQIVNGSVKYLN